MRFGLREFKRMSCVRRAWKLGVDISRVTLSRGLGMKVPGAPSGLRNRGDGVFEDQLLLGAGLEQN